VTHQVEFVIKQSNPESQSLIFAILFTFVVGAIVLLRNSLPFPSGRYLNVVRTVSLMTYPMYLLHETFGLYLVNSLFSFGFAILLSYFISALAVILISYFCVRTFEPLSKQAISRIWRIVAR
jgi:hypothetical protein